MDPATQEQSGTDTGRNVYALAPHLIFDPNAAVLLHRTRLISLTVRECALLNRLLRTPCCYVSTGVLSRHLSKPGYYPISEHSIQQSICDLRAKLGVNPHRPRLLLTKRGLGYGIFPQMPHATTRRGLEQP